MTISRFDFSQAAVNLMNKAVEIGVLDAVDLGVLIAEHGTDTAEIFEQISGFAFTNIHCDKAKHVAWCTAQDAYFAERMATTAR